jgi:hypothetical protein
MAREVRRRSRPPPPPTATVADAEPDAAKDVADYEVGYKTPPKDTQFKPGQSRNPNGRPKGARNLKTDLADELQERIVLREGGERRTVSKQRAMLKLMERALIREEPSLSEPVKKPKATWVEPVIDAEIGHVDDQGSSPGVAVERI